MSASDRTPAAPHGESATPETLSQRVARVVEDPMGSAIAGLVAPATAFGCVISGMYGLALIF